MRLPDYQLTCRERERGRGLVSKVIPVAGFHDPGAAGLDRWTIFVHGFNNSFKSIAKIWTATVNKLRCCKVDLSTLVLFYWPGDYSRWQVVSAMNYPRIVPIAEQTAHLLDKYIRGATQNRSTPLEISFVAHSLGALVVLETMRLLRSPDANVRIIDVLLMAAAIPEGFCVRGQAYGERFSLRTEEVVLYSPEDSVLKWWFKLGQEIAARIPTDRYEAVGRYGGPGAGNDERWSRNHRMYHFGHGYYWRHPKSIARIASVVGARDKDLIDASCRINEPDCGYGLPEYILSSYVIEIDDYITEDLAVSWVGKPVDLYP